MQNKNYAILRKKKELIRNIKEGIYEINEVIFNHSEIRLAHDFDIFGAIIEKHSEKKNRIILLINCSNNPEEFMKLAFGPRTKSPEQEEEDAE